MLSSAILIFFVAIIFGLNIFPSAFYGKSTPKVYVYWHGPIALLGISLVLIAVYYGRHHPVIMVSTALFILAALGGLTLFTMDMLKKPLPGWLVVVHPILAVIALILLIIYVWEIKKDIVSIYADRQGNLNVLL